MSNSTQLHWKTAFCLWLVIVTVATHLPAMQESENPMFVSPDKMLHFVSFGVLAMTFWCAGWMKRKRTVILLLLLWSIVDEVTQALLPLDRPFSIADLTAGMLGVFAAASWMGALSQPHLRDMHEKIDVLLSKTVAWYVLCPVAIIGTIGTSSVIWLILWKTFHLSYAPLSLCLGLLLTTSMLLVLISFWTQCSEKELVKKLLPKIITLGMASLIVGFATVGTEVGQYTMGLAFFTIGSAYIWRATITDNPIKRTM
jgi:VanZ family protein